MIKMVAFYGGAGMAITRITRMLQRHGLAVWPFWRSFGKTKTSSSLPSVGCFQGLLQLVCYHRNAE